MVGRCRRIFGTRKVGHSGTLDPMATGVLVLGVGRATRLLTFLGGLPKTYEAVIRMGVETDSLDADGEVTVTHRMDAPDLEAVRAAARDLTGDLQQVPPMVSAKKVDGRRLHELARRGAAGERAPAAVAVTRFDVEATDDPMVVGAVVAARPEPMSGSSPPTSVTLWAGSPPGRAASDRRRAVRSVRHGDSSSSRRIRPRPPPTAIGA